MQYIPNYSNLIGKIFVSHWVWGYTIFKQSHFMTLTIFLLETNHLWVLNQVSGHGIV